MEVGKIIKIERQRKNIRQDELAIGICSPSYLSKIETGSAFPSEEILKLFLQRLNISPQTVAQPVSPDLFAHFKKRFGAIINRRDHQAAQSLCLEIRSFLQNNKGNPHTVSLIIIETRLLLLTTSDIKDNLSFISALQDELSYIQKFHVYIIQGIIAYNENRFSDAQNLFTNALLCTKQYRLEDWEMAELHYMLSLAAISEYQHILAIEHIEKALTYFNQKVLATRSIDCLLILGNAQKYTKNIIGAIASFNNAKDIMIENGYVHRAGMIEHNLGACYSLLQNHTRALHHFTQSLSVKVHADEQIATIFAIVKEYKKSGNQAQAKLFINKGLSILNSVSKANQELYRHHFSIYRALLFDGFDIILVFESALAYFQGKKSNYYCFIYCHVLADQLVNKKQFKLATTYYKRAFLYHLDHHQVKYWEELT